MRTLLALGVLLVNLLPLTCESASSAAFTDEDLKLLPNNPLSIVGASSELEDAELESETIVGAGRAAVAEIERQAPKEMPYRLVLSHVVAGVKQILNGVNLELEIEVASTKQSPPIPPARL